MRIFLALSLRASTDSSSSIISKVCISNSLDGGDEDMNGEKKQVGAFLWLLVWGHHEFELLKLTADSCCNFLPKKTTGLLSESCMKVAFFLCNSLLLLHLSFNPNHY